MKKGKYSNGVISHLWVTPYVLRKATVNGSLNNDWLFRDVEGCLDAPSMIPAGSCVSGNVAFYGAFSYARADYRGM